jgi:hypothetical protein
MGFGPPKMMKSSSCSATTLPGSNALPLSSRPERTRISYFALLALSTCAALRRESRMRILNATSGHSRSFVLRTTRKSDSVPRLFTPA